jgi:hypothetical protein
VKIMSGEYTNPVEKSKVFCCKIMKIAGLVNLLSQNKATLGSST